MKHTPPHPMLELRKLGARHPLTVTQEGKLVEHMTSIVFLKILQVLAGKDEWPDISGRDQPRVRLGR